MSTIRFHKDEPPDRVHGRLLASIHLTGYSFDRACDELKWLLRQDRWKQVSPGFSDINKFLATMDLSEFRPTLEQRKDLVKQLAAIEAGQRATARLLGVDEKTIRLDKRAEHSAAKPAENEVIHTEGPETLDIHAEHSAPPPYYSEAGITIYHGDCRELLPSLPHGLMVTDPPYNVGYHYDEYHDAMTDADYWTFLYSVLRMPLVFIHYPENLFPLAKHFARSPDKIVAWVYHANTPRQWRAVAWFGVVPDLTLGYEPYRNPTDKRIRALLDAGREGARLHDWWEVEQVKNVSTEKEAHPCQIPTVVMKRALQVTPFDGPVIDPFCGSGTTLLAAQELGRQAIGIESSEEYCEIAKNRLRQRPLSLEVCG